MKVIKNNQVKPYIIYLRDEQITTNYTNNHKAIRIRWDDGYFQSTTSQNVYSIDQRDAEKLLLRNDRNEV